MVCASRCADDLGSGERRSGAPRQGIGCRVRTGRIHPDLAAAQAPRPIGAAVGAIATTTRQVGAVVPEPTGRTRPVRAAAQAPRRTVAVVATGAMVDVATTTGVMDAVAGTTGVMAGAIAATGAMGVMATETAGVMAAAVDAMAGATTGTVGPA